MTTIATTDVKKAADELARMRGALASWLKFRTINDGVLAGTAKTRRPLQLAQAIVTQARDMRVEQDLANKLYALLTAVMKGQSLPSANLTDNPSGAVQLAQIAINGGTTVSSPTATGGLFSVASHPWLWPVLIVGGLLLTVTTAIKTSADVAKDREEKACIEAGACTDYGFWLKLGGIAAVAWIFWDKLGRTDRAGSMRGRT